MAVYSRPSVSVDAEPTDTEGWLYSDSTSSMVGRRQGKAPWWQLASTHQWAQKGFTNPQPCTLISSQVHQNFQNTSTMGKGITSISFKIIFLVLCLAKSRGFDKYMFNECRREACALAHGLLSLPPRPTDAQMLILSGMPLLHPCKPCCLHLEWAAGSAELGGGTQGPKP